MPPTVTAEVQDEESRRVHEQEEFFELQVGLGGEAFAVACERIAPDARIADQASRAEARPKASVASSTAGDEARGIHDRFRSNRCRSSAAPWQRSSS